MVNKKLLRVDYGKLQGAVSEGLSRISDVAGVESDPMMIYYNRLEEPHFRILSERFGVENVSDFIKQMEFKKRGKNG